MAAQEAWKDLAKLLWRFDAHIQDVLAAVADTQAVGYQLGRGLAETYWALDPAQDDGSTGWSFLLGEERCAELGRLIGRLGAYMGSYTAPAVAGTIVIWRSVAENSHSGAATTRTRRTPRSRPCTARPGDGTS